MQTQLMKSKVYIGIDLGLNNSVISWGINLVRGEDNFNAWVIPIPMMIESNRVITTELLPSYVYFGEGDVEPIVGEYAKTLARTRSDRVVKSIQTDIGTKKQFKFGRTVYTPVDITVFILRALAEGAALQLGIRPEEVIITVPAHFDHNQRAATIKAAKIAGFQITDNILLDVPHAALYAFVNRPNAQDLIDFSTPKLVTVFDLSRSTLNVSVHKISYGQNQQLDIDDVALVYYNQIGGNKFDELLADHFLKTYQPSLPNNLGETQMTLLERIFQELAEEAKKDLSIQYENKTRVLGEEPDPATVKTEVLQTPFEDWIFQYDLTLSEYEQIIASLLPTNISLESVDVIDTLAFDDDNIIYPILDALDKAALGPGTQIDAVLLNGGMAKLSVIQKRLKTFFGPDTKILASGDPDKVIALGATYYHYYAAPQN